MDVTIAALIFRLALLFVALVAVVGGLVLTARGMRKKQQADTELALGPLALKGGGPGLAVVALGVMLGGYAAWTASAALQAPEAATPEAAAVGAADLPGEAVHEGAALAVPIPTPAPAPADELPPEPEPVPTATFAPRDDPWPETEALEPVMIDGDTAEQPDWMWGL